MLTHCGSRQGFASLERRLEEAEEGRVVRRERREGVQVPGAGVLLIQSVVFDMARDGVN